MLNEQAARVWMAGRALRLEKLDPRTEVHAAAATVQRSPLVKTLEESGIGRPSTYASIINTIQDRDYVVKHGGSLGLLSDGDRHGRVELLVKNFPYIFDTAYTATLEGELDAMEDGKERGPIC